MKKYKCIKSLYKSTYKKNAFTKNKYYYLIRETDEFIYMRDSEGKDITFARDDSFKDKGTGVCPYNIITNHFNITKESGH